MRFKVGNYIVSDIDGQVQYFTLDGKPVKCISKDGLYAGTDNVVAIAHENGCVVKVLQYLDHQLLAIDYKNEHYEYIFRCGKILDVAICSGRLIIKTKMEYDWYRTHYDKPLTSLNNFDCEPKNINSERWVTPASMFELFHYSDDTKLRPPFRLLDVPHGGSPERPYIFNHTGHIVSFWEKINKSFMSTFKDPHLLSMY